MKILVIGSGFIGTQILNQLESEGHEMRIYSRSQKKDFKALQIVGDIFDFNEFAETLSWEPQVIIHTAWLTTHEFYAEDLSNAKYAEFTSLLAKRVSRTRLEHLIVLGTCAEYGPQTQECIAGITELNPNSFYGKQKVLAFNSTREALLGSNVRLSWARVFQPFGPNQDSNRLIPYMVNMLQSGSPVNLKDTTSILDWITTRDIASAISWIIRHETPMEVDIGTGNGYTNLEVLEHLEALIGGTSRSVPNSAHSSVGNRITVVGKESPLFVSGWRPQDSLEKGLNWVLGRREN
jgi:nucleoside-diphosphate-sugar epimerase